MSGCDGLLCKNSNPLKSLENKTTAWVAGPDFLFLVVSLSGWMNQHLRSNAAVALAKGRVVGQLAGHFRVQRCIDWQAFAPETVTNDCRPKSSSSSRSRNATRAQVSSARARVKIEHNRR